MGKNVAVFVDVANIFYAAKAAGVDIDYVTLLKAASAGRDLVRAYAYTGLDPDNENQRNFHDFLRRSNYKVVSKDIRKYGDGKVKANLDIELVVDMMKTARNLDIAIVVSGDGDFAPAIRAVQEQGVRVEVISFRGNTSSDLIEVADQFTDIVQLARVEKGTRSGRRVAEGDDLDLSMTEVPDKQTEGTGVGRSRGRGRGRGRDAEPVAASARSRSRTRSDAPAPIAANGSSGGAGLVALPGERLSRAAGPLSEADLAKAEVFRLDDLDDEATDALDEATREPGTVEDGDEPRRRRRRGGRGRGRGRGRAEDGAPDDAVAEAPEEAVAAAPERAAAAAAPRPFSVDDEADIAPAPRTPRATPFGSVWDSQLGTPSASTAPRAPITDDEDFDEPEIPEYLIAEQRRGGNRAGSGGGGGGRGARGGRSAYQSAMDRERYGRGGGGGGGGINRYPDVSARPRPTTPPREERAYGRSDRPAAASTPRNSNEPWSDVPPELEAMLRAQVAQKPGPGRASATPAPVIDVEEVEVTQPVEETAPAPKTRARRTSTRASAARATGTASSGAPEAVEAPEAPEAPEAAPAADAPAAKPRASRKPSAKSAAATPTGDVAPAEAEAETGSAPKAAKPRATRKSAAAKATAAPEASVEGETATVAAPKRRSTRKAAPAETA